MSIDNNFTIVDIAIHVKNAGIKLIGLRSHSKATEQYVDVVFEYPDENYSWTGSIPYQYRRRGMFLDNPKQIAELVLEAYESVRPSVSTKWQEKQTKKWESNHSGRAVTKPFFDKLLNLQWNCVAHDLPQNPNWARRIQDIKEMGYLLATNTNMACGNCGRNTTHILLVPMSEGPVSGYEVISPKLKERIIKVLGNYDAFEGKVRPSSVLIPDHKFPEISWDEKVRQENLENLTDDEIKQKFQLLDNQRNLQKREACRQIIQTGKRGELFGIKYYREGDEDWPKNVPKTGKAAEKGWIGSPWYDIEAWRQSLNDFIKKNKKK